MPHMSRLKQLASVLSLWSLMISMPKSSSLWQKHSAELVVLSRHTHRNRLADELGRQDYVTGEMWKNESPFRASLKSGQDLSVDLSDCVMTFRSILSCTVQTKMRFMP